MAPPLPVAVLFVNVLLITFNVPPLGGKVLTAGVVLAMVIVASL